MMIMCKKDMEVVLTEKTFMYYLKKDAFSYLLMLPGLLYYLIFKYIPMFGIIIAFKEYKPFWEWKVSLHHNG